jgi:hypothetical protein
MADKAPQRFAGGAASAPRALQSSNLLLRHYDSLKKTIDSDIIGVYHLNNTGKEVVRKYMVNDYSEVAEA